MRTLSISSAVWNGALAGGLLTAPLIGVLYLGHQLAGLPFAPFTLFDWLTLVLPGSLITLGLDTMISLMRALNISVANMAKLTEQIMAVVTFWLPGVLVGSLFFVVLRSRSFRVQVLAGLVPALLIGLPLMAIEVAIGQSNLPGWVRLLWLALVFGGWGVALGWSYHRLLSSLPAPTAASPPPDAPEQRTVERIDRRTFLIKLGASSATITLIGAGGGALLAMGRREERPGGEPSHADTMDPDPPTCARSRTPTPPFSRCQARAPNTPRSQTITACLSVRSRPG